MSMMTEHPPITGGVDTHKETHVAAALDARGALLGVESFPTTRAGYRELLAWLGSFGPIDKVGVEGTGAWGAGLTRVLTAAGVVVLDVDRPNRQKRRRLGKNDPTDAINAARAAQSGDATTLAKTRNGDVEKIRVLRVVKRTAHQNRRQALVQLRGLIVTAPDELRDQLRDPSGPRLVAIASSFWPGEPTSVLAVTKHAMRELARRGRDL